VREPSIIRCAICPTLFFRKRRRQRPDMRANAPPAAIRAAPMSKNVHPRRPRSGEMLGTALRALFLSASERSRFVSCTIENLSLYDVDHYDVDHKVPLRAETCNAVRRLARRAVGAVAFSSLRSGGYPEIFSRDLRDRQIISAAEEYSRPNSNSGSIPTRNSYLRTLEAERLSGRQISQTTRTRPSSNRKTSSSSSPSSVLLSRFSCNSIG
jgi:hypothetical protein